SYIALTAMQEVPLGTPKLCLSTLAAKDLSRSMGHKDIVLMPSVVDVAGLNSFIRPLIAQAAAALCAMATAETAIERSGTGRVAISMFGNTTGCVDACTELLKKAGYEVMAFHANGVGGQTMEALIREGCFEAVLDVTTTELADDLCGGVCSAGPDRLTAATDMGIPQVVVPGCMDMVNFAQPDTVPAHYRERELYSWAPNVTLMRTNEAENRELGKRLVQKLDGGRAPATVVLPLRGVSQVDAVGGVFFRPATDHILFEAIREYAPPEVEVLSADAHINDPAFAETLVTTLLQRLHAFKEAKQVSLPGQESI
ncbi:MAG: Tm-1-like ATP-binding domain-containing protein, partial [Bacteroidetes bacterium]|nr:Tm-1-like ATP-binding domain-containing protein [Bacteroidota bacterium]